MGSRWAAARRARAAASSRAARCRTCWPISPADRPAIPPISPTTVDHMRDYRERLAVPAAYWILAVPVILLLGAYAIYADLSGLIVTIVYVVFTVGYVAVLLAWGSGAIEVTGGELRAAGAVLPLARVTAVQALDEKQAAAMRGPQADPAAHMLIRPWLKAAAYLEVDDPAGQVPYWLIGTRRPTELATVIERGRTGSRAPVE